MTRKYIRLEAVTMKLYEVQSQTFTVVYSSMCIMSLELVYESQAHLKKS